MNLYIVLCDFFWGFMCVLAISISLLDTRGDEASSSLGFV